MNNVVQFKPRATTAKKPVEHSESGFDFMERVMVEAGALGESTGRTPEEAIKFASDIYSKYPMLIEHVRSVEYITRDKKK